MTRIYTQMALGSIIAERRSELGLSQGELARKLDYDNPSFISLMECGRCPLPLDKGAAIARALKFDEKWFVSRLLWERHPDVARVLVPQQPSPEWKLAASA